MTDTPSGRFSDEWVQPLLELGPTDPAPEARLAALQAAAHFPLGPMAWRDLAKAGWQVVRTVPAGSQIRRAALAFAASVPLLSLRETLRRMAEDPDEPDRDAIAAALEQAGDPSRIRALVERAASGDHDAYRLLAIAPLEDTSLSPADLPPCPEAALWRALAIGRIGNFDALEDVFAPEAPLPELFWGSPWVAYDRIAAIRPIPEPLSNALRIMLSRLDDPHVEERAGHDLARALRLTVWAATGMADAEGSLLPPPRPFGPVLAPEPFRSDKPIARLLHEQVTTGRPTHDDGQIAWMIAGTPTADLIGEVVLLVRQAPEPARLRLLDILAQSADVQAGRAPTPFRGAGGGAGAPLRPVLIDDRTRSSARPPSPPESPPPPAPASRPRGFGFDMPDVDILSASRAASGNAADLTPSEERTPSSPLPSSPPPGRTRGVATDTTHGEFQTASRGAPPPTAAETDERHVRATILHAGKRRDTFVAGAANVIRCWVGLPEDDGAASSDAAIPTVPIPQKGLELTVELCWGEQRDSTTLLLPASRSARSGDCDLRLDVPADERYVSAEIMFRYRGRSFEVVRVEAAALAPGEAAGAREVLRVRTQLSRREVIAVDDAQPCNSTLVFGPAPTPGDPVAANGKPSLRVFDGSGGRNYALKSPGKAIEALNTVLFSTEKSLVRHLAASRGKEEALDAGDEEVRILLRDMARFGAGLFNQLDQQGFVDPGDRIQLLSLDPDVILPLEFVYDRGYPVDTAHMCAGWQGALEANATVCPACGDAPLTADARRHAQTVCPLGFWSLRKVIERLNPERAASASAPAADRRSLPAIDSAVFASSNKVPEDERNATWETIRARIANATLARHWDEWYEAVKQHPRLLIALPHHDEEPLEDFLEIGDESLGRDLVRLGRGQIRPDYVNPDGREPGPILLLLGCRTGAESELGYVQLVREFQKLKTAIVLGTLAQILGRHAAPLARELVTQLLAVNDPDADFGTLMRRVRRHMLGKGYLLALCLVALGDAEWRLTPASRPSAGAPSP
jgi:hypothetical protein